MKVICECGKEGTIHCPPAFGETMGFALGHECPIGPVKIKAVCICGAEREIGPGVNPGNAFNRGMNDGEWFEQHAVCDKEKATASGAFAIRKPD
jgi:hypothetical protein